MQFVVFCAIMSMAFLVGSFLAEVLNNKFLGMGAVELSNLKSVSSEVAFKLKLLNPILLIFILMLPALLFAYLAYPSATQYLGLHSKTSRNYFAIGVLILFVSLPFVSALEEWMQLIPFFKSIEKDNYNVLTEAMLAGTSTSDLIINTLSICLIPALAEELLFRGCMQQIFLNWLKKYPYIAILIVAIIFSAFHGQLSGFIPRVYLGFILGLVYYYTGNLWITIVMHFINNFISVFFVFLKNKNIIQFNITENTHVNIFLAIGSLLLSLATIYILYKKKIIFIPKAVENEDHLIEP